MGFAVDGSERPAMSRVMEAEVDRTSMSSSIQQEDDILLLSGLCCYLLYANFFLDSYW